jgi:hypothetical protein
MANTLQSRTYNGGRSYPIPVWNGIFEHRKKIGPALWIYLWCLDRITDEESGVGFVLGSSVVTTEKIAGELQDPKRTVRRHLERLAKHKYIGLKRTPYGFIISVANSKKFNIWRSDKNVRSLEKREWPKMTERVAKNGPLVTKNGHSNKEDTAVDTPERLIPPIVPLSGGLTPRQLKNLSKELNQIYQANVGRDDGPDFEDQAIRTACLRLCLPLDAARKAISQSYGESA